MPVSGYEFDQAAASEPLAGSGMGREAIRDVYRVAKESLLMDQHGGSDECFVRPDIDERTVVTFAAAYRRHLVEQGWRPGAYAQRDLVERGELLGALEMALRLCEEALPKFNWAASALDANAVTLLNEAPGRIRSVVANARREDAATPCGARGFS